MQFSSSSKCWGCFWPFWSISGSGINLSEGSVLCMLTDFSPHWGIKLYNVPLTSSWISLAPAWLLGRKVNTWSTLLAVSKTATATRDFRIPYRTLPAVLCKIQITSFTVVSYNCQQAFKLLCLPYLRKHRRMSSLVLPFSVTKHKASWQHSLHTGRFACSTKPTYSAGCLSAVHFPCVVLLCWGYTGCSLWCKSLVRFLLVWFMVWFSASNQNIWKLCSSEQSLIGLMFL